MKERQGQRNGKNERDKKKGEGMRKKRNIIIRLFKLKEGKEKS